MLFPVGAGSFLNAIRFTEAPALPAQTGSATLQVPSALLKRLSELAEVLVQAKPASSPDHAAAELISLLNSQELSLSQLLSPEVLFGSESESQHISPQAFDALLTQIAFLVGRYHELQTQPDMSDADRQAQLLEISQQLAQLLDETLIRRLNKTPVWYLKWMMEIQDNKLRECRRNQEEQTLMGRSLPYGVTLVEASAVLKQETPAHTMRHSADLLALLAAEASLSDASLLLEHTAHAKELEP